MTLSILIPTINERRPSFKNLVMKLTEQIIDNYAEERVEIVTFCDKGLLSIGAKRNTLLSWAVKDYCCFVDDDDTVSSNYIEWALKGVESGRDCCSLLGLYTVDGHGGDLFEHSIRYKEYKTNPPTMGIKYERSPNHLNIIKTEIAQAFKFAEINHGEDTHWATEIRESGLIKTEFSIPDVTYHYQYRNK